MKDAVSLANLAPSAALAQTSLTRSGSIPKPFNVRQFLATVDGALAGGDDPHAAGGWNGDPASV